MATTANDAARVIADETRNLRHAARDAARRARATGSQEVERLISEVEELIERLADTADPGMARIRNRVAETLRSTRRALSESAVEVQRQARQALTAGDTYVRAQPWEAIGVAAVMGVVIGFLLLRR
jgi:ElaB protein